MTPFIFLLAWNRPIYLWNCLDSIYRNTRHEFKLVLADNNSSDTAVKQVIHGFQKRKGFFHEVHFCEDNSPFRFPWMINKHWDEIDEIFVFVEGDIEILGGKECWLGLFVKYFQNDPNLGLIGSRVHKRDFVSIERAKELYPSQSQEHLSRIIKENAPMRRYKQTDKELIDPHNPPLRLLAIRKSVYQQIKFGRDVEIYARVKKLGYKCAIATKVVHRHLSLLNIYDYPDISPDKRDNFFDQQWDKNNTA